jgi:hypothetical protein
VHWGGRKPIVLATFAVAAILLASCGGGDSNTPKTTTASPAAGSGAAKGEGESSKGKQTSGSKAARGKGSKGQGAGDGGGGKSSGSEDVSTPLRVSGGGSKQFREKGGDNSIQEYGDESDESELQAAAEAVHGFYVARSEEDWTRACSYLAKSMVDQLEALAEQSPKLKDGGCAPVLKAFTRPLPVAVRRELTVVDAASLRREDERGFLIYYDSEHKSFAMPLKDEDGAWKLTLLSATPLG